MGVTLDHGQAKNVTIVADEPKMIIIYNQNGIHSRFPGKTWEEPMSNYPTAPQTNLQMPSFHAADAVSEPPINGSDQNA